MTYKKTWLSYLLWAIFTCIMGVMLANYTILLWKNEIDITVNYGTILFVFLVFAVVAGVYFLLRKMVSKIGTRKISSRTAILWETFIVLCIFFTGFFYRFCLYMQSGFRALEITEYYHLATVKAGETIQPMLHGVSYLYTLCLSFVFSFLGNKPAAAVWFQILIQMVTLPVAFFTVRKIAGRIPACVAMLTLAVSSVYTGQILSMTPESLLFLLYLTGLFIVGSYIRNFHRHYFGSGSAVLGAFVSGMVIGILTYLDAVSLTLIALLPALLCGMPQNQNQESEERKQTPSFSFLLLLFVSVLLFAVLTFIGMFALDASVCLLPLGEVTSSWFTLYGQHLAVDYLVYRTDVALIECFIPVVSASLLIMAFWNRRREENVMPWILLMIFLAPTPLAKVGVLSYEVYAVFVWSVLAGIGLQQSLVTEGAVMESQSKVKVKANKEENKENTHTVSEAKETPKEPPIPESPKTTEIPESKPRFLENPLPLPKKHEKRVMDYDYDVSAEKMRFDIECAPDDDFDI